MAESLSVIERLRALASVVRIPVPAHCSAAVRDDSGTGELDRLLNGPHTDNGSRARGQG